MEQLAAYSVSLSRNHSQKGASVQLSFAPKGTLRGQLQRWRDQLGKTYDESVQFILEDNLLNHLLSSSESVSQINSFWLTQSCKSFYERALSATYMPLYLQFAINELTKLFQRMHKPSQTQTAMRPWNTTTGSQSFVPSQRGTAEMSPERIPVHTQHQHHMLQSSMLMSPKPNLVRFDSAASHNSSAQSSCSNSNMFSPHHDGSNYSAASNHYSQSPALGYEQLDSARRQNPLIKQFSNSKAAQAIQNFMPKVNAFDPSAAMFAQGGTTTTSGIQKKESNYECILMNKDLDADFFQDSSTEEDDDFKNNEENGDECGLDEVNRQFKFNEDHCLHVFNTLKQGGAGNQFDMQRGNQHTNYNNNYVNLNGQNRAEYLRHIELIDLQLDFFNKKQTEKKRRGSSQSNRQSTSQEDSTSSDQTNLQPPQSLKEIFEISNKNRKLNKQRKKSKLESYQSSVTPNSGSSTTTSWEQQQQQQQAQFNAAPPPQNVHQIIQFQYRHDCQLLSNGQLKEVCMSPVKGQSVKSALQYNSQLRNMSDMQFMRHLGWMDTGSRESKRPSANQYQPQQQQQQSSY